MKAIILRETGGVDNLIHTDIERPTIKENEVLIKVKAIGINPVDVGARASNEILSWITNGAERPVILGWDISGVVVAKGKNVDDFDLDDAVFGMVNFMGVGNAYAEYVAAPADQLAKKPDTISYQEATATTLAALTALQSLSKRIKKGNKVLIHAGSGGVGHFAIQIAKHLGAYVMATSSKKNKDFVLSLGTDRHIDYTKERFDEVLSDMDFVLDTIGGDILFDSMNVLKPGGTIVALRSLAFSNEEQQKAEKLEIELVSLLVSSNGEDMNRLKIMLEDKIIKPHISKTFDFENMDMAHKQIETNRTVGKVVVTL